MGGGKGPSSIESWRLAMTIASRRKSAHQAELRLEQFAIE